MISQLSTVHAEEEKDIEAEIGESSEFRSSIHKAISQIELCLQENKVKNDGAHDQNVSFSVSSTSNSSYSDGKQNVRGLPSKTEFKTS